MSASATISGPASRELVRGFLSGGGELGALMRAFPWETTPLGPPESWPQNLKMAMRIMLTSRQPIWIGWGEELIYFYNDPYKSIIGGKHPWALGRPTREVWREIWRRYRPMLDTAMGGDQGTYVEAQLLIMERNGYPEETYYTFSYSPIPNDDGQVGGIFCANSDDTQRVIGERQLALLRDLAAEAGHARDWQEACVRGARGARKQSARPALRADLHRRARRRCRGAGGRSRHRAEAIPRPRRRSAWTKPRPGRSARRLRSQSVQTVVEPAGPCRHQTFPPAPGPSPRPGRPAPDPADRRDRPRRRAGRRPQPVPPVRRQLPGLPRPRRRADRRGHRQRAGLRGGAPARRGAGRDRPRQDDVLLQRQPRVPHAADADARADRGHAAGHACASAAGPSPPARDRPPQQPAPAQAGQLAARLLAHRGRPDRRELRARPTWRNFTAEAGLQLRVGDRTAGLWLRIDCPSLPEPVYVDRDMWEKIVLNLLSNAFKFTFEGEIAVELQGVGGRQAFAQLTVRDTGVGIPQSELPRLFERFHRIEGQKSRSFEGSGIGLALVQELVRLHGGTIRGRKRGRQGHGLHRLHPVRRRPSPDRSDRTGALAGSTSLRAEAFVEEALRWLPSDDDSEAPDDRADDCPDLPSHERTAGARIVVADDNADMRNYVRRLLQPRWEVEAVSDGRPGARVRPGEEARSGADRCDDAGARWLRAAARTAQATRPCAICRSSCCPLAPARKRGWRGWTRAPTTI